VVAKVEFHPGELFPRVGFIVTNRSLPNERVLAFYNDRGTAEQHIKEGEHALEWTRLACMRFAANAVRLQLHALAYSPANFLRTPGLARANRELVADVAARTIGQDRRAAGAPRPLRRLPARRGRSAARGLRGRAQPDQRPARAATDGIVSMMGDHSITGGGCGDGKGVSAIRAYRNAWHAAEPVGQRPSAIHRPREGAQATSCLIGRVGAGKLNGNWSNG
jgi:alkylhydroperoxidase family enzyme